MYCYGEQHYSNTIAGSSISTVSIVARTVVRSNSVGTVGIFMAIVVTTRYTFINICQYGGFRLFYYHTCANK